MVLCHYDGVLRSGEEYLVYIGGERRVVLTNGDVAFEHFEHFDWISIYVIKLPSQTTSHLRVETQDRCVPNLNEYIGQAIEECALDLEAY